MKGKSIRYLNGGGLEVIEIDVPAPGPGEVQVSGGACGICAWDLYTFKHGANAPSAAPPGHEGVGYVTKVGADVVGIKVGDRVCGGGFATLRNLRASSVYRLPESELPDELWMVEPVACIVTGVDHTAVRIGDRVALVGCGFMGLGILQCLLQSFAEQVIAIDISPDRLALAEEFGADVVLNPTAPDFDECVQELLQQPIDTVVDASGSQAGLDLSTRLVKRNGRINLFGWIHGPATFSGDRWHLQGINVVCSAPSAKLRDTFPVSIRLIDMGMVDMRPLVTHVVTLDEMASLLDRVTKKQLPEYIKGVVALA